MWRLRVRHSDAEKLDSPRGAHPFPEVKSQGTQDDPNPRFLGFLLQVTRTWGVTFRLAFLVMVAGTAIVLLFWLSDHKVLIAVCSVGVYLVAKLKGLTRRGDGS